MSAPETSEVKNSTEALFDNILHIFRNMRPEYLSKDQDLNVSGVAFKFQRGIKKFKNGLGEFIPKRIVIANNPRQRESNEILSAANKGIYTIKEIELGGEVTKVLVYQEKEDGGVTSLIVPNSIFFHTHHHCPSGGAKEILLKFYRALCETNRICDFDELPAVDERGVLVKSLARVAEPAAERFEASAACKAVSGLAVVKKSPTVATLS